MPFLRCVVAEWLLVRPRLWRTRFGLWLLVLGVVLVWLGRAADPLATALHAGALGAVLGAAFSAGADADRAALTLALAHPTTPLAVAAGRWLGAVLPATGLVALCTIALGGSAATAAAGIVAAAAVGACALAAVLALGNSAAALLFLTMALAGAIPPERLVGLAEPGVLRLAVASALELGPAPWRYRAVAVGDPGALLHAAAWTALGVLLASALMLRPHRRRPV